MSAGKKKILVLGARGMLGTDLTAVLKDAFLLTAWDIEELDITDGENVRKEIVSLAPDEVINCAAYTDVDGCESNETLAMAVNAEAPGHIARACADCGARLIHIGSDYVFDGETDRDYRECDTTNPLSAYGRSKLEGDERIETSGARYAIIRSQWLYGRAGKNFVDTILRLAGERDTLQVVDDQVGKPTWTAELARGIAAFVDTEGEGIYHLAAGGICSWFEYACEIVSIAGLSTKVEPVDSSKFPRPARRPARSALDCSKIESEFNIRLPHWRDSLRKYLGKAE